MSFFFCDTGKGLGKDENGITEPVKLATNQNKKGIGYDENEPWWEGLFNNATKNIKVETHGDLVSLNVVKNASAIPPRNELGSLEKTVLQYNYKKFLGIESRLAKANAHLTDQKPDIYGDEAAYETTKDRISGKLERLAEQDRIFLNVKPPLNATPAVEDVMAYRKTNAESDVEGEEERKTDNDANASQSGEETSETVFRSKTTMKKHRKRINKLVEQLGTCNLEEKQNLPIRRLSQKMKKNKEENKMFNSNVLNYLRSETKKNYLYTQLIPMCNEVCTKEYRVQRLQLLLDKADRDTKSLLDQAFRALSDSLPELARCGFEKDSIEVKVESRPELENSVEGNGTTDDRFKDWVFIGLEDQIQVKETIYEQLEQQNVPKVPLTKSYLYNISSFGPDRIIEERYQNFRRLNKVGKKKGFQCCPSKNRRLKRVTEMIKGEALSQEMNSVIKNLMAFGLSEEVNANIIKKRPTQTHLTPV